MQYLPSVIAMPRTRHRVKTWGVSQSRSRSERDDNLELLPTETALSVWHDRPESAGRDVPGSRKPSFEHDARFPTTKICSHKNLPSARYPLSSYVWPAFLSSSSEGFVFPFCNRDTCTWTRPANDEDRYGKGDFIGNTISRLENRVARKDFRYHARATLISGKSLQ